MQASLIWPSPKTLPTFDPLLKIGILASGKGSNFLAIIKSIESKKLDARIQLLIVNNQNCKAIDIAKNYDIPYLVIDHRDYSNRIDYDKQIVSHFNKYLVEGIVMAGWMRISSIELIKAFPHRIINIHPSILPSFKGQDAIEQTIKSGVKLSGCTVHFVEEDIDSGPIIIQASVPVLDTDDKYTLLKRIQCQEHKIIILGISIAGKIWRDIA